MPEATLLDAGTSSEYPVIRDRPGQRSQYAPLDVPIAGDIDRKVADLAFGDTMLDGASPDQFVLVIGDGMSIFPLNIAGKELRLTLGAQVVEDLVNKLQKSAAARTNKVSTIRRADTECEDLVIGYRVLGRSKAGDVSHTGPISGPPSPQQVAGPFDGNFQPAFMEVQGVTAGAETGPSPWVEYLHGPLTFRCPDSDRPFPPDQDPIDIKDATQKPGQVPPQRPNLRRGPFQTGRSHPGSSHGNGPFGPAFLDDESGEQTAVEGDQA